MHLDSWLNMFGNKAHSCGQQKCSPRPKIHDDTRPWQRQPSFLPWLFVSEMTENSYSSAAGTYLDIW